MKVQSISCRKVYKFRMEPTELEARELERTACVARYIYNWALACCQQYYRQHGKGQEGLRIVAEGRPETVNACGLRVSVAEASIAG